MVRACIAQGTGVALVHIGHNPMLFPRWTLALLLAGFLGVIVTPVSLYGQGPPSRSSRFGLAVQDNYYSVLNGQVRFDDGRPAAGALVRVLSDEGEVLGEEQTDTAGRFSFTSLQRGNDTVVASLAGYRTASRFVSYSEGSLGTIELTLVRDSSAAGGNSSALGTISVRDLQVPEKARREYEQGVRSLSRKKNEEARKHFETAIRIDPKFGDGYRQLGLLLAEQGEFPRAEKMLEKAIQINGKDSSAYGYLGYAYQKSDQLGEAEQAYQQSVRLSDANWLAQMGLGQVLVDEKRPTEALAHLRRAQQTHPQEPSIYLLVYNTLIFLDRGPDALRELDDFLARFPKDPVAPKLREVRKGLAQAVREASASH